MLLTLDSSAEELELQNSISQLNVYEKELSELKDFLSFIENNNEPKLLEKEYSSIHVENYVLEYKQLALQLDNARKRYEAESTKSEILRTQNTVDELFNDLQAKEAQLQAWKSQQQIQLKDTIKTYSERIDTLKMRISSLQRAIKSMSLYAPIDGYVSELVKLNEGDYLLGGTEVLRIISNQTENLKAEIVVDASNVARIKEGQKVKLRFQRLPPCKIWTT